MDLSKVITPELRKLRDAFIAYGFDLRLVGGVVRDLARGVEPKDIDLCTDADPIDQIVVYKAAGVPFYETGIAHGTISVRAGGVMYEITSLRTESDHDGRHAIVSYTRDWMDDLGRRDLTFNAMAMTFDGELIDPFNGLQDLKDGVVRFVGNPDERMREDYLRILRWLRFHGRMAASKPLDPETVEAAQRQAEGLRGISRERVWMEVAKIISGPSGINLIDSIYDLGLAGPIGLPIGQVGRLSYAAARTKNPITLMVALLYNQDETGQGTWSDIATDWKWSAAERDLAAFLVRHGGQFHTWRDYHSVATAAAYFKGLVARDGIDMDWVIELALIRGETYAAETLKEWAVPTFPVTGNDLMASGMKPGPEMGAALKRMKAAWADSDYALTKAELLVL